MRVRTTANMGAYLSTFASCIPTILYATVLAGQYKTAAIYCEVTAVFTNTTPVDAYRGAGRPEATYVVERLVETAAREMKKDPAELRRQNFITEFPYQTPVALCYDTGNYAATLDAAMKIADVAGFKDRREQSQRRGKLRGLGSEGDIEYERGVFKVAGTDKKKTFGEVAFAAYVPHNYPLDKLEPGLNENAFYDPANFTFPAGSYVCEVEVDRETGVSQVVAFTAVDDFGKIINPMIVEGQVHGGVAQGIGQALTENCAYDEAGQLTSGTLLDYCIPRASDLPLFKIDTRETPSTHNPLGAKGRR